ncbi:hypothetical protein VTK26DRAFT_2940 [Humicola hyalothermophila]
MRWSWLRPLAAIASLTALVSPVLAEPVLESYSLNQCQENSGFQASLFKVRFWPDKGIANVEIAAVSSVEGYVRFDVSIRAYGYEFVKLDLNPCETDLRGLCPMTAGKIPLNFNVPISGDAVSQIPGIAYTFPDLDATVTVFINRTDEDGPKGRITPDSVACVTADVSNGKTVDLLGVKWATAIVAALALVSSAIVSGLGHQNAAAHVAANALSLFGYFQSQAMIGLMSVHLPPIVMSWTQDFQWSMGIIHVEFMQDIFTWYQRATGGTPATIFQTVQHISVQVEKRAVDFAGIGMGLARRSFAMMPRTISEPISNLMKRELIKRGNIRTDSGSYLVYGIQRVAYRAGIETTNLFLTSLVFFCILVVIVTLCVAAFKGLLELAAKKKWIAGDTFVDFRNGWLTVLKGIHFRLTLIGFPAISILSLWEFTQKDSAAEVVLAVFFLLGMIATLGWASFKVIMIARRSVMMHQNPAYILFSDPQALNKWGFLYVQFRASAYYFILPVLGYTLLKAMFIAFAQHAHNGVVQAVAFLILEAGALIGASVLRPWMDKKTNAFNIAICAINFVNSIFVMVFTEVFNQPPLVTGVVGVVLWLVNAIFSLILLLMLIGSTIFVFFRENPDGRYQFMADDRTSFMKSQTHLTTTTELDALAATARGDKSGFKGGLDLDDDAESITSDSLRRQADQLRVPSATGSYSRPRSPASPSMPLFPADGPQSPPRFPDGRPASPFGGSFRSQNNASPSPWQRGAGYDH